MESSKKMDKRAAPRAGGPPIGAKQIDRSIRRYTTEEQLTAALLPLAKGEDRTQPPTNYHYAVGP